MCFQHGADGRPRSPVGAVPFPSGRRAQLFARLRRDHLHLAKVAGTGEGVELNLTDAFAGEAEPLTDLLERLRLLVDEAVAQDEHLSLALSQCLERDRERLAAERSLDALLRQRVVAGDEVAEDGVLLVANRLVEACRGPRGGAHLARLLDR